LDCVISPLFASCLPVRSPEAEEGVLCLGSFVIPSFDVIAYYMPLPYTPPTMKRFLALSVAIATLTACSGTPTARYQLTMNVTKSEDVVQLTQESINVMQRRLEGMDETMIDNDVEETGSGSVIVSITAEHAEALATLTDSLQLPFDFAILAQVKGNQKADVTVEKFGGFAKTGITGNDLSWVEADKEPGQDLGRVHLIFTDEGRTKMADLFKKMKGKNIGIFVRGQLVSLLEVETDVLKDDIVIQQIPSFELAQAFAEDVNVGIHVTITPLP